MKAIIQNTKNSEMSLCYDIDITLTPIELIYDLIKNHPNPEKLLGGANVQLLKDHAVLVDSIDLKLETDKMISSIDEEDSIMDYIIDNHSLFDSIETPTFLMNTSYYQNNHYFPYRDLYESYKKHLTDYLSFLIVFRPKFSFKSYEDEYGITGGVVNIIFDSDIKYHFTPYSYSINLECRGTGGEYMMGSFKYVSDLISDESEMKWWKDAILYNKLEIENDISIRIEDNYDHVGFRIILSKELDVFQDPDYIIVMEAFEETIDKIIINNLAFRGTNTPLEKS